MLLKTTKPNVTSYLMEFPYDSEPDMHHRCMWARINIDHDNFILSAITDCGNYSHQWPASQTETFAEFLCHMSGTYLLRKIARRDRFDLEKSKAATIVRLTEDITISPDDPRLQIIQNIEDCGEELFCTKIMEEWAFGNTMDFDDIVIVKEYAPGVSTFIEIFEEYLKPQLIIDCKTKGEKQP